VAAILLCYILVTEYLIKLLILLICDVLFKSLNFSSYYLVYVRLHSAHLHFSHAVQLRMPKDFYKKQHFSLWNITDYSS